MQFGKTLIAMGVVLIAAGIFVTLGDKLPLRLGRLPGDVTIEGKNGSFYFPVVTCMVVSLVLTLVGWLVRKL